MVNDITIGFVLVGILLFSAWIIPSVQNEFSLGSTTINNEDLRTDSQQALEGIDDLDSPKDALGFFGVFFKLIFWDLGGDLDLPIWLQTLYTLIFITSMFLISRNVWVGGGG